MPHSPHEPDPSTEDLQRRPTSNADLGFDRKRMVQWLDPHQLVDTSARVLASGFVASYTDSREMQALVPAEVFDRSGEDEVWLDYVSDLGDGFNSTYTVARLLARKELELSQAGQVHRTERGQILVMGGDQVYPVPTRSQYENRFLGPYRAAMPRSPAGSRELFAIPGSHDWYDGLLNFSNIFCRHRSLGGLKTRQTRSYFALLLPHRWWLWGVDLQFGDYLDETQLTYFAEAASEEMEPGDRIIVCMAKEVESGRKSTEVSSDRSLGYLEREVVQPAGGRVMLYLKSGRHYYSRYEQREGPTQLITAGGGGAFMHPTHDLPELTDSPGDGGPDTYRRATVYPSQAVSKRLRKRVWLLTAYNLHLAAVLGLIQVLLVFMINLHLGDRHRSVALSDLPRALWESPTAFLLIILLILSFGGMIRLAHDATGVARLLIGLAHSMLQFVGLAVVIVVASGLSANIANSVASLLTFLFVVWAFGGLGGVVGISGYLWATNCLGFHGNEAFAPLHHQDLKNFLRLHIDRDGELTVFPIGIDRVGRRWRFCPDAPAHEPWLAPVGDEPAAHLIEAPVVFGERVGKSTVADGPDE
jgi:hypothetical protein